MAKKGPFDKFGLGGVRRKSPGNDPNIGKFEARLRKEAWTSNKLNEPMARMPVAGQSGATAAPPPDQSPTTWWQFLSPNDIRWNYITVFRNLVQADSGVRTLSILTVPKAQTFVITHWMPMFLRDSTSNSLLLDTFPANSLSLVNRAVANLTISGSQPIQTQLTFGDFQLQGTTMFNRPAWPSAPNLPVIVYAGATTSVDVTFQWNTGLDPNNEDMLYAAVEMTGFYIAESTLNEISAKYGDI